jgi:hypothetical protein
MHYIHQDGQQVFKYAVKKMSEMTERVLEKNNLTGQDVDCFIAHQANKRIILATAERLKMPLEKVVINIERFGNTTAGTIPLAMQTAVDEGKLKKGDLVLLARWARASLPARRCCAGRSRHGRDYCGHGYSRYVFSFDGLRGAEQAGRKGAWGFDLSAACSAFLYSGAGGRAVHRQRCAPAGAGDRRRRHVVDHRLHGPRHMRDLRRRSRGCDS